MGNTAMAYRQPLPDVQSGRGELSDIALDWVGMQDIALPLEVAGRPFNAEVSVGVSVCANRDGARGIHMSRLYLTLDALTQGELTPRRIINTLAACLQSQTADSERVRLEIGGELLLSRAALLSPQRGWKSYPLHISATLERRPMLTLQVGVPYSSTCPASAALSRQAAQQQFLVDIETDDGALEVQQVFDWLGAHGMPATPHSQRSWAWVTVTLSGDEKVLPAISLIDRIEQALGTPVQTLVKRQDEQAFALANGRNLMFCEDAARRLHDALRRACCYRAFSVRVEHQESLHAHNAVAQLSWREGADAA